MDQLPDTAAHGDSVYRGSVLPVMYKKLIENSLDILFDRLAACKDKGLVAAVSNYLMLAVYRVFRQLYQASPKNVASMFRISRARWQSDTDAAMHVAEADLQAALAGESGAEVPRAVAALDMTTAGLTADYPRHATSLMNLIKNSEETVRELQR